MIESIGLTRALHGMFPFENLHKTDSLMFNQLEIIQLKGSVQNLTLIYFTRFDKQGCFFENLNAFTTAIG